MKILNINKNHIDTIPKKTFQYILNTYSYGLSKNIWRNYSIQTQDSNYKKTKITFYKSNFSFPIIKIIYSKKFDKEIFEVTYKDKKKNFSTLNSLNVWKKKYLNKGGNFLVKNFQGEDTEKLFKFVKTYFDKTHYIKPAASDK